MPSYTAQNGAKEKKKKKAVRNPSECHFVCLFLSLSAHPDRYQLIANLTPINLFTGCQERKSSFSPFHPPPRLLILTLFFFLHSWSV